MREKNDPHSAFCCIPFKIHQFSIDRLNVILCDTFIYISKFDLVWEPGSDQISFHFILQKLIEDFSIFTILSFSTKICLFFANEILFIRFVLIVHEFCLHFTVFALISLIVIIHTLIHFVFIVVVSLLRFSIHSTNDVHLFECLRV